MDHPLRSLIEERLREAEEAGAFENLPGAGKPLPDLREAQDPLMAHLTADGPVKFPVTVLREGIGASKRRLATLTDEEARKSEMKNLSDLQMRLAMELESLVRYG